MWFDETLDARAQPLVEALLVLLANGQRWRHRRVETLTPVSATFVRRRISIDFTVPDELHGGLRLGASSQWLVPLGWLARRQLVNFDLRVAADEPVPLLLGEQTARVTADLLVLAAVRAGLDTDDPEAVAMATDVIERAADDRAAADARALERRAWDLGLEAQFASLVGASARGFLLLAVLPHVAGRQIVKVQSDEHYRDARFTLSPELPGLNEAASTHVELELPDVLRATSFELWDASDDAEPGDRRRLSSGERRHMESRERPRLLLAPVAGARRPYVRASLVVSASEFLAPAVTLAMLAVAILGIGLATHIARHATGDQGPTAATILLAAFAALSGLVLRVEKHPLVRAILARPRAALGATGLGVVVAAVPIGLQLGRGWILAAWWAALAVCLVAAVVLWVAIIEHTERGRSAR
jgi:hypothetical protein